MQIRKMYWGNEKDKMLHLCYHQWQPAAVADKTPRRGAGCRGELVPNILPVFRLVAGQLIFLQSHA